MVVCSVLMVAARTAVAMLVSIRFFGWTVLSLGHECRYRVLCGVVYIHLFKRDVCHEHLDSDVQAQ